MYVNRKKKGEEYEVYLRKGLTDLVSFITSTYKKNGSHTIRFYDHRLKKKL